MYGRVPTYNCQQQLAHCYPGSPSVLLPKLEPSHGTHNCHMGLLSLSFRDKVLLCTDLVGLELKSSCLRLPSTRMKDMYRPDVVDLFLFF